MNYLPNRRVVSKKPVEKPTKWLVIALFFLVQLFCYTLIRLESANTRTEISKLQVRQQALKSNSSVLVIEKERLKSPKRILDIARTDLNLTVPSDNQVFYINLPGRLEND